MRIKTSLLTLLLCLSTASLAQWQPAGDKIKTDWAEQIDPNNVLSEYPRPIMERSEWMNLNGLWDYSIVPVEAAKPAADGQILVPFAVESSLSGVMKTLGDENALWYERTFKVPSKWKGQQVLLHFDAVDWQAEVWLNDIKIGEHRGGYTGFSFDITPYLTAGGTEKLTVKVWDPTDKGPQPRGKQVSRPGGIWYTPVSGIWQTVWLEPVAKTHINHLKNIPDIDNNKLNVTAQVEGSQFGDYVQVKVMDAGKVVAQGKAAIGQTAEIYWNDMKLWSPENPFLYDMEVELIRNGKAIDQVKSYTSMRKMSTKRDGNGVVRFQLNNEDYFPFGLLDQGWWPDGLYTAPSDEALKYDIDMTKKMGYNLIRKHVKVEPARWYTHCDKLGILVWQDMPNGDDCREWQMYQYYDGVDPKRTEASEDIFKTEWKGIIDALISYPSIVTWVPFNECWGQFKTEEIVNWTKEYDPSRLVNPASGGNHYAVGDMLDIHHYPNPQMDMYDGNRATVLGEYGGIGLPLEGHLWFTDRNWGYVQFKNSEETTDEYVKYANQLLELIPKGFSAAIYTQTTDLEGEVNGLMTYDRKVVKMDLDRIREVNLKICNSLGN